MGWLSTWLVLRLIWNGMPLYLKLHILLETFLELHTFFNVLVEGFKRKLGQLDTIARNKNDLATEDYKVT